MRRIVLVAGMCLAVAACGKGGTVTLYTRAASSACLQGKDLTPKPVTGATDFVASSATGGAFRVQLKANFVMVSFGLTLDDAANISDAYQQVAAANVGIADVLRTQQNAVMLWHAHPSDADLATITGCLKR